VTDARETFNIVFKISPVTDFLNARSNNGCRAYVLDGSRDNPYGINISLRYPLAHVHCTGQQAAQTIGAMHRRDDKVAMTSRAAC
jgi:hypothetical protein